MCLVFYRPPMIIFMVLMGGLVFIGLVMTIIAVWPGYTPVGGNPLKIAGPILLSLGGMYLISIKSLSVFFFFKSQNM